MAKVIVVEYGPKKESETNRFIQNWFVAWSFINTIYRVEASVGVYRSYVPAR
jgi:hypothetical protein